MVFRHGLESGMLSKLPNNNITKGYSVAYADTLHGWPGRQTNGRTYRQTGERADKWKVTTLMRHIFLKNNIFTVICVKFHHDRTST